MALTRANETLGRAVLTCMGFGRQELDALMVIAETGRLTPGDIARSLHLPGPTVTAVVDRLERSTLAVRCRDSVDRRKVYVTLTEAGEEAVRAIHAHWLNAFCAFDADELPQVFRTLNVLARSVLDQTATAQRD